MSSCQHLRPGIAQLAFLHVSASWRGAGDRQPAVRAARAARQGRRRFLHGRLGDPVGEHRAVLRCGRGFRPTAEPLAELFERRARGRRTCASRSDSARLPLTPGILRGWRSTTGSGARYRRARQADPRIAAAISGALGDAAAVVNVGAGRAPTSRPGPCWPSSRAAVMLDQRPPRAAPAVEAVAEALPLPDDAVDAALAVLTVHHWSDVAAGVAEMRRVARRRAVVLHLVAGAGRGLLAAARLPAGRRGDRRPAGRADPRAHAPARRRRRDPVGPGAARLRRRLRRRLLAPPEAYLDPDVRAGMSVFATTDPSALAEGWRASRTTSAPVRWHRAHADLLKLDALDVRLLHRQRRPLTARRGFDRLRRRA